MSKQLQHRLIFKYTSNNLFSSYINACFYTGLTKLQIFQPIVRIQCIMNSIWFCTFVLLILLFQHIKHYISFLTLRMERQNIKHNLFSFDILHLHVMSTATVQREIKSEV